LIDQDGRFWLGNRRPVGPGGGLFLKFPMKKRLGPGIMRAMIIIKT
jgi:hypothetical protein